MASSEPTNLPERSKEQPQETTAAAPAADGQAATGSTPAASSDQAPAPSKKALAKAAKEREKAEKAAKRAAEEEARRLEAAANDPSKHAWGSIDGGLEGGELTKLNRLATSHVGTTVRVQAYVQNARIQSAKLAFLDLRDSVHNIQAVIAESDDPPVSRLMIKFCGSLSKETIVRVQAKVAEPKEPVSSASISHLELHIISCFVVSHGPPSLEMQLKDAIQPPSAAHDDDQEEAGSTPNVSLKTRLDNRVLDLRVPINQAIFEINSHVASLFREYMSQHHFNEIWTPKIVGAATEGGSGVFELKYFDTKAYLTQSPQFFKQMAISGGFERVFEIGPVFRAENSNTKRHLTEFTGLDFEMVIYHHWEEIIDEAEALLLHIFRGLRERCAKQMEVVQIAYPDAGGFKIPESKAPRIRFADGIKMLHEAGVTDASEDEDIDTTNEKKLGQLVREKYGTDFYFLTHFPSKARPFYTHVEPDNPKLTRSYDAFMRGQEICSGAQRIHQVDMLTARMKSMEPPVNPADEGFRHYIDAFRRGCPPHGGGGFGLNRITMLWLGLPDVRQATFFPRDPQRLAP